MPISTERSRRCEGWAVAKSSKKHPFNQAGEMFMVGVLFLYLWSTISVFCRLQGFNPLMFSLREQYAKVRGTQ